MFGASVTLAEFAMRPANLGFSLAHNSHVFENLKWNQLPLKERQEHVGRVSGALQLEATFKRFSFALLIHSCRAKKKKKVPSIASVRSKLLHCDSFSYNAQERAGTPKDVPDFQTPVRFSCIMTMPEMIEAQPRDATKPTSDVAEQDHESFCSDELSNLDTRQPRLTTSIAEDGMCRQCLLPLHCCQGNDCLCLGNDYGL